MTTMLASHSLLSDQDNRLLRAWRRGELDAAAAQDFETRLFLEPDLLRAAELDQGLAQGLAGDLRTGEQAPRRRRRRFAGALGLALAAGVAGLTVWPMLPQTLSTPAPMGNVEWVSLDVSRSTASPMRVAPRTETRLVAMELGTPTREGVYSVDIRHRADGRPALSVSNLNASDGLVSLAFERSALAAGDYLVELRSPGGGDSPPLRSMAFRYQP